MHFLQEGKEGCHRNDSTCTDLFYQQPYRQLQSMEWIVYTIHTIVHVPQCYQQYQLG